MFKERFKNRIENVTAEARSLGIAVPDFPESENTSDIRVIAQDMGSVAPTQKTQSQDTPYSNVSNPELRKHVDEFTSKLYGYAQECENKTESIKRSPRDGGVGMTKEQRDSYRAFQQEELAKFEPTINAGYLKDYHLEAVNLMAEMLRRLQISAPQPEPLALVDGKTADPESMKDEAKYLINLAQMLNR